MNPKWDELLTELLEAHDDRVNKPSTYREKLARFKARLELKEREVNALKAALREFTFFID